MKHEIYSVLHKLTSGLSTQRKRKSLSRVRLFVTPWTVAHQAHLWDSPGKGTGVGCHFLL